MTGAQAPRPVAIAAHVAGDLWTLARYAARRFAEHHCPQAAAALTFTSLLALVPLMTITVTILSAFPAFQDMQASAQELIFNNLVPQVGAAVRDYLETFVGNAGKLTAVGVVALIVTAVLLLATIESAFNEIWRVRESRPWLVRLLSFWAILTLTPLMFTASLSVTNQFVADADLGVDVLGWRPFVGLLPGFFEFIGIAVLYRIIPNRPVHGVDAAIGGLLAAVLFELSKSGFAFYLTTFPVYETIYGALSTIPIFLVWLYLAWSIVLLGALVAAVLPDWRAGRLLGGDIDRMPPIQRVALAFAVLRELAAANRLGVAMKRKTLLRHVPVSGSMLEGILDKLRRGRFVERTASDRWLVSRDLTEATLYDLMQALRIGLRGTVDGIKGLDAPWCRRLDDLLHLADRRQQEVLAVTLDALVAEPDDSAAEPVPLDTRAAGRP
ncbi:MAG: YihY family inner membrane protein [Alphaproteobacteria bacterium]